MANGFTGAIMPLYIPPPFFPETVQGSMGEPPQELSISPTGTSNSLCSRWPK